ncbi:MAG: prepilin-type N-terminal cleavage/methylation domain-containing protein [Kiritimatiellae bacterium]|nr:prepilin-type N-terminal cleavage/methylation domain-containing protein [Kiritimatiellia bacterium]
MKTNTIQTTKGFTLVELLAAMAVLSIIVLIMTGMLNRSSQAWKTGADNALSSDMANRLLDTMQRDASVGVVDEYLPLYTRQNEWVSSNTSGSAILFLSNIMKRNDAEGKKDFQEVCYFCTLNLQGRGVLVRRVNEQDVTEYATGNRSTAANLLSKIKEYRAGLTNCEVVANNVYQFRVSCYDSGGGALPNVYYSKDYTNKVPGSVEVQLLMLDDDAWTRLQWVDPANKPGFAVTNGTIYATTLTFGLGEK